MEADVTAELRAMFIDGATVSRMFQYIESQNKCDNTSNSLYLWKSFCEAFGVPLIRGIMTTSHSPCIDHAHFNTEVVPDIVQRIDEWCPGDLTGTWLDGVRIASYEEYREASEKPISKHLERAWPLLQDEEKDFIISGLSYKDYCFYLARCLARLAERLQEKIAAFENERGNNKK